MKAGLVEYKYTQKSTVKLSIVTICYNQEKYISQALDSFLSQNIDFDFEIIIADDCSTDDTQKIITSYVERFPSFIKPILRKSNIGVHLNLLDALKSAKGEYIALCEGDDFWTDNDKLQKQLDFMDSNKNYSLCFHPVRVFFENNEEPDSIHPNTDKISDFTVEGLLRENYIQTNSVVYRRQDYSELQLKTIPADWYLHLFHAQFGKIGFINSVMSAYRRHSGGVWWAAHDKKDDFWIKYGQGLLQTYNEIFKLYGSDKRYNDIIYESVSAIFSSIFKLTKTDESEQVIQRSLSEYPNLITGAYLHYKNQFEVMDKLAKKEQDDIISLHADIKAKNEYIHDLETQLKSVYDNKTWHLVTKLQRYKNKLKFKK